MRGLGGEFAFPKKLLTLLKNPYLIILLKSTEIGEVN